MFKKVCLAVVVLMLSVGPVMAGPGTPQDVKYEALVGYTDAMNSTIDQNTEAIFGNAIEIQRLDAQKADKKTQTYYMSILGGANTDSGGDYKFDTGWLAGAALGMKFDVFRAEMEYQYAGADFKDVDSDIKLNTVMGNVYYDFGKWFHMTPYLTGGFGVGWFDVGKVDADKTSVMAKFGGGVDVAIVEDMTIGFRYTYQSALDEPSYASSNFAGVYTLSF